MEHESSVGKRCGTLERRWRGTEHERGVYTTDEMREVSPELWNMRRVAMRVDKRD
jgi:hypothetical protein